MPNHRKSRFRPIAQAYVDRFREKSALEYGYRGLRYMGYMGMALFVLSFAPNTFGQKFFWDAALIMLIFWMVFAAIAFAWHFLKKVLPDMDSDETDY